MGMPASDEDDCSNGTQGIGSFDGAFSAWPRATRLLGAIGIAPATGTLDRRLRSRDELIEVADGTACRARRHHSIRPQGRQFMLFAVNMPEHEPQVGQAERSRSRSSSSLTASSPAAIIGSIRS